MVPIGSNSQSYVSSDTNKTAWNKMMGRHLWRREMFGGWQESFVCYVERLKQAKIRTTGALLHLSCESV